MPMDRAEEYAMFLVSRKVDSIYSDVGQTLFVNNCAINIIFGNIENHEIFKDMLDFLYDE